MPMQPSPGCGSRWRMPSYEPRSERKHLPEVEELTAEWRLPPAELPG